MRHWAIVILLTAVAFYTRTVPAYDNVFAAEQVNFQETDAWFHVRTMQQLVRHFPRRMAKDPDALFAQPQNVDTGPLFDYLLATPAWVLGANEAVIDEMAAWYPAVLGALIIPAVFVVGRLLFGLPGALFAAAMAATLPGQFLLVSSLGFTDHHVLESLLSVVVLWRLLRAIAEPERLASTIWSGLALAAYLLTFNGGAFLVAIITIWAFLEIARAGDFPLRPVCGTLMIAAPFALSEIRLLWVEYSVAATVLGAIGLFATARWRKWCLKQERPILFFTGGIGLAAVAALALAAKVDRQFFANLLRLTAQSREAATVWELRSLTRWKGFFSLEDAWSQYGGVLVLSIIALLVLAELTWRKPEPSRNLLFVWSAVTGIMAMSQMRMGYYFAASAALLSGYVVSRLMRIEGRDRWIALAVVTAITIPINAPHALAQGARANGISADWFEALRWLREHTPEPVGDRRYSILAWWDYGYWITSIAHRIPVANPTQQGAELAAGFLLATDGTTAMSALKQAGSKYVIADHRIPFLGNREGFTGTFLSMFAFTRQFRETDYMVRFNGRPYFRPAYYRSMAVRLYLFGTESAGAVAFSVLHPVTGLEEFRNRAEAEAAEQSCRASGCMLVSADPMRPCVNVEALQGLQQVGVPRSSVRIFEVRN